MISDTPWQAIAINTHEDHSLFPALFLVHEQYVCSFYPFNNISPEIYENIPWQDWILSDNVVDNVPGLGYFKHQSPSRLTSAVAVGSGPPSAVAAASRSSSGGSSVGLMPGPNFDLIIKIHSIICGTIRVVLYVLFSPIYFFVLVLPEEGRLRLRL